MKPFLLIVSIIFYSIQSSHALDVKESLGISNIDLTALNIEELVSDSSIITNTPIVCTAVTYILYGSAKEKANAPAAKLIEHRDRKVSDDVIASSKEFLMNVSAFHTNAPTRAMAGITIAFAYPDDKEISDWMYNRYFFADISVESKNAILGIIRAGNFTSKKTDFIVKSGLMGMSSSQVVNAASCVKNDPKHYKSLLPDIVLSLLTLEKRNTSISEFGKDVDINVSYLFLTQAIGEYHRSALEYLPSLEKLADISNNQSVRTLVLKLNSIK